MARFPGRAVVPFMYRAPPMKYSRPRARSNTRVARVFRARGMSYGHRLPFAMAARNNRRVYGRRALGTRLANAFRSRR